MLFDVFLFPIIDNGRTFSLSLISLFVVLYFIVSFPESIIAHDGVFCMFLFVCICFMLMKKGKQIACRWINVEYVLFFLCYSRSSFYRTCTVICSVIAEIRIDLNTYGNVITLDVEKMTC